MIKILKHLTRRGSTHVNHAINILTASQTSRESIVYQLFLRDILRYYGLRLVVLYAASLGKQRVVHLTKKDRTGLVGYLKNNKSNLYYPALESLCQRISSSLYK